MPAEPLSFHDLRPDPEGRLKEIMAQRHPVALLLDQIDDPRNAGALFRLADAARCSMVYGYRTGNLPAMPKVKRVARSTQLYVPFKELDSLDQVEALKKDHSLIGLDITRSSVPYDAFTVSGPVVLMVGNEAHGLCKELLGLAEACVHIPMYGMNTSMNVAVATGIAVYGLLGKSPS